jgi:hypothetical protein
MKNNFIQIFCLLILSIYSSLGLAQQIPTKTNSSPLPKLESFSSKYILSYGYLQWNEKMHLQSGGTTDSDVANFVGNSLTLEKNFSNEQWGFSYGGMFATGKAAGGGNSTIVNFQSGNQSWSAIGGFGKIYQKINPRFYVGLMTPLYWRQMKWSSSSVTSGKDLNMGLLIETTFRLTPKIDFFQGIGTLSFTEGSTLWRIGVNYRMN